MCFFHDPIVCGRIAWLVFVGTKALGAKLAQDRDGWRKLAPEFATFSYTSEIVSVDSPTFCSSRRCHWRSCRLLRLCCRRCRRCCRFVSSSSACRAVVVVGAVVFFFFFFFLNMLFTVASVVAVLFADLFAVVTTRFSLATLR